MENLALQIIEENKPIITANFEGDLATLANNIDKKRKEIKRDFSQPIVDFENKCKELIDLINNVKGSIDEGIKVFDDKTREEKRQYALKCIEGISAELELEENGFEELGVVLA